MKIKKITHLHSATKHATFITVWVRFGNYKLNGQDISSYFIFSKSLFLTQGAYPNSTGLTGSVNGGHSGKARGSSLENIREGLIVAPISANPLTAQTHVITQMQKFCCFLATLARINLC